MKKRNNFNKIGLYIVSLTMLFAFVLILSARLPMCYGERCEFIGFTKLISTNIVPLICIFLMLLSLLFYCRFKNITKYNTNDTMEIIECKSENYENLTFLATYIIPFIGFTFEDTQKNLAYFLLLIVIGLIFIRTDKYYANPTLALFGYKLYKVKIKHPASGIMENLIGITMDDLAVGDNVYYSFFDDRFFIARKKNEIGPIKN
ncbi:hypothetical protein L8O29_12245 [Enterobacter kobei]|uniref:anti-phage protein KwaA n=1 Tax=Enterobacter kobei TaxID=208224 RepID=UPI00200641FF|nr:anti-phage protein KwaA [Enterobacter kobei]MCK7335560.1 hypothetical protein [Enterobacter kobei]